MTHIRAFLFSLLALTNNVVFKYFLCLKVKERQTAAWKIARKKKERNTVKDYLRNVNSSVSQYIQCIQNPKIASSDLMQYYEGFL